jgi:hypothetical protein
MAKDRSLGLTLASIAFGDETKDEKHVERAASGPTRTRP